MTSLGFLQGLFRNEHFEPSPELFVYLRKLLTKSLTLFLNFAGGSGGGRVGAHRSGGGGSAKNNDNSVSWRQRTNSSDQRHFGASSGGAGRGRGTGRDKGGPLRPDSEEGKPIFALTSSRSEENTSLTFFHS